MLTTKMESKSSSKARIGKFILDTLSIGMYNNALMLLREYVQNSVDAIDEIEAQNGNKKEDYSINIEINGRTRSIIISDNGSGISAKQAWTSLHDLGRSVKRLSHNRGFRGIGRLGGLGYCSLLKFTTKSKGEKVYTVSEWDCKKLRSLLNHDDHRVIDVAELIDEVVNFNQYPYHESQEDHFFTVELQDVYSSRDILLNVPAIKAYLAQVAPLAFNNKFKFAERINTYLKLNVPHYKTYSLFVNREQIFKPYTNEIAIGKENSNRIKDVRLVELKNEDQALAFGWLAELDLQGSINPTSGVDGLRLRMGNILIGDNYSLCELFRERRFNNYLAGELHIVDHRIVPNSRRDGFEDNNHKDELFNLFIKDIGLPYSRMIRDASKNRNNNRQLEERSQLIKKANKIIKDGYLSHHQKKSLVVKLTKFKSVDSAIDGTVNSLIKEVDKTSHYLDRVNRRINPSRKEKLKSILDIIYTRCQDFTQAEQIAKDIIKLY